MTSITPDNITAIRVLLANYTFEGGNRLFIEKVRETINRLEADIDDKPISREVIEEARKAFQPEKIEYLLPFDTQGMTPEMCDALGDHENKINEIIKVYGARLEELERKGLNEN